MARGYPRKTATKTTRLTGKYPNSYYDFFGSRTPCVFKSGPDWFHPGPHAWSITSREARPVYRHPIAHTWLSIGRRIYHALDSISLKWTSINPLAYANKGEAEPFCPLILSIGVKPQSLTYDAAVAAAAVVKQILAETGFPDIEVAFVESVVTRSVCAGPKLLSLKLSFDKIPELRKPFTPTLGLAIAPLDHPHFEGTAGLYFRMGKDDKRIALLTCAHVARPPAVYDNKAITHRDGQARQEFVALGYAGYNNAVKALMDTISNLIYSIESWNNELSSLGDPVEGEDGEVTKRRKEHVRLVEKATEMIGKVDAIHDEVTKRRTIPEQRVIGFLLHSEKIEVEVEPHEFTKDWALIELYDQKIDWSTFGGNRVYVAGNLPLPEFVRTMFPQDRADYKYLAEGLLQASTAVPESEMLDPQHLDIHGHKCLLVVKNGPTTGTTVGRTNGLESFTRISHDRDRDTNYTSIAFAVLPYDTEHGKFSDAGDSGAVVLARDGRIVGIITGGAGSEDRVDITYITPYWWVEQQIKAKYPDCFLHEFVPSELDKIAESQQKLRAKAEATATGVVL